MQVMVETKFSPETNNTLYSVDFSDHWLWFS